MGKTGKWLKSFLSGKKEKGQKNGAMLNAKSDLKIADEQQINVALPVTVVQRPTTPKEKRRWSFRRSTATSVGQKDASSVEVANSTSLPEAEVNQCNLTKEVVNAAAAAEVRVEFTDTTSNDRERLIEEFAAIKIQSVFRSYLARKALKALRGLVKLQALVRGHLVRKQTTDTLRSMQALVTAQARARAQRIRLGEDGKSINHRQSTNRRNSHDKINHSYHDTEENIKIVEMDHGEYGSHFNNRNNYLIHTGSRDDDRMDGNMPIYYSPQQPHLAQKYQQISPAASGLTDLSPRTCSGHFNDYTFATAQSSPQCFSFANPDFAETMSYEYPLYPSYMANTESSRAKARSQSAPKQRPEFERQPSRGRRPSVEGRNNIPKGGATARMQRSSSHVSSTCQNYQYPWSIKLDKSTVSLMESECGSSCSVFMNGNYCKSVGSYDPRY